MPSKSKGLNRRWTEPETAKLLAWAAEGIPYTAIGERLKRNFNAISAKIRAIRAASPQPGDNMRPYEIPTPRKDDHDEHLSRVFDARPLGFPVAFSRPHFRMRAA